MGKRKQSSKGSLPSHPKITPQPPPSTKNVFGKLNEDVVLMLRKYLILPTDLVNLCRCNKETRKLLLPELYKHVVLTARILLANGGDTLTKLVHPRNLGRRSIRSIHLRSPLNQEDGTELMFLQAAERLLMAVPLDQLRSFRWDIPFELPISFLATLLDRQAHLANVQLEHAGTATFEGLRDRIIEAHAIRHSLVKLFIADAACWDTSFASHLFTCCNISRLRVEVPYAPTNASRDALFELDNAGNLQTDHFGEELFKSWMHLPAGVTAPVKLNLTSLYLERVHLELCKDTWAQAVELRSLTSLYLFHCPHAEMFTWALTRGRAVAEVPLLRTLDITNHELDSLDADNMIIALNTYLE